MTMLLPLFILVGFIAGYFVNAMAYHLSPLEDKTALTFRQVLVHFWQKNMPGMIQCPDTLRCCCYRLRPGTFHAHRDWRTLSLFLFRTHAQCY